MRKDLTPRCDIRSRWKIEQAIHRLEENKESGTHIQYASQKAQHACLDLNLAIIDHKFLAPRILLEQSLNRRDDAGDHEV